MLFCLLLMLLDGVGAAQVHQKRALVPSYYAQSAAHPPQMKEPPKSLFAPKAPPEESGPIIDEIEALLHPAPPPKEPPKSLFAPKAASQEAEQAQSPVYGPRPQDPQTESHTHLPGTQVRPSVVGSALAGAAGYPLEVGGAQGAYSDLYSAHNRVAALPSEQRPVPETTIPQPPSENLDQILAEEEEEIASLHELHPNGRVVNKPASGSVDSKKKKAFNVNKFKSMLWRLSKDHSQSVQEKQEDAVETVVQEEAETTLVQEEAETTVAQEEAETTVAQEEAETTELQTYWLDGSSTEEFATTTDAVIFSTLKPQLGAQDRPKLDRAFWENYFSQSQNMSVKAPEGNMAPPSRPKPAADVNTDLPQAPAGYDPAERRLSSQPALHNDSRNSPRQPPNDHSSNGNQYDAAAEDRTTDDLLDYFFGNNEGDTQQGAPGADDSDSRSSYQLTQGGSDDNYQGSPEYGDADGADSGQYEYDESAIIADLLERYKNDNGRSLDSATLMKLLQQSAGSNGAADADTSGTREASAGDQYPRPYHHRYRKHLTEERIDDYPEESEDELGSMAFTAVIIVCILSFIWLTCRCLRGKRVAEAKHFQVDGRGRALLLNGRRHFAFKTGTDTHQC